MHKDKRKSLKLAITGFASSVSGWVTPSVIAISLPAHAQTSSCAAQTWLFDYSYCEVICQDSITCSGTPDQQLIDSAIKPSSDEPVCLTKQEIDAGQFNRDIDIFNSGVPAAYYVLVNYIIESVDTHKMTGRISCSNVDIMITVSGTWVANWVD